MTRQNADNAIKTDTLMNDTKNIVVDGGSALPNTQADAILQSFVGRKRS